MALIEREALRKRAVYLYGFGAYKYVPLKVVEKAPTIDAAPVVHARWIMRGGRFRCSACDAKALWRDIGGTGGFSHEYEQATTVVCPHCGAQMDGGEGHG